MGEELEEKIAEAVERALFGDERPEDRRIIDDVEIIAAPEMEKHAAKERADGNVSEEHAVIAVIMELFFYARLCLLLEDRLRLINCCEAAKTMGKVFSLDAPTQKSIEETAEEFVRMAFSKRRNFGKDYPEMLSPLESMDDEYAEMIAGLAELRNREIGMDSPEMASSADDHDERSYDIDQYLENRDAIVDRLFEYAEKMSDKGFVGETQIAVISAGCVSSCFHIQFTPEERKYAFGLFGRARQVRERQRILEKALESEEGKIKIVLNQIKINIQKERQDSKKESTEMILHMLVELFNRFGMEETRTMAREISLQINIDQKQLERRIRA